MDWNKEWKALALSAGIFLGLYFLPPELLRGTGPLADALGLAGWYAREHVVLCLLPAFLIAGGISIFVSQGAVMRYLGPGANPVAAYGVAAVSGALLAVCSCTILPLFAGIYAMGAGLGPAATFLYAGPAINVMAVVLTAAVLGLKLGVARAVAAMVFSVAIGLAMQLVFRKGEAARTAGRMVQPSGETARPLRRTALFFAALVGVLVFANWGQPTAGAGGLWQAVYGLKWWLTVLSALGLGLILVRWFGVCGRKLLTAALPAAALALAFPGRPTLAFGAGVLGLAMVLARQPGEPAAWIAASWGFARQIMPLLLAGVLLSGALLGMPGAGGGLIPTGWIAAAVGGESLAGNLFAAVAGAFMYFATLTEVPILQGLLAGGMGQGPALALLIAGPALSLPSLLVLRQVIGDRKTLVFLALVVGMATLSGLIYGWLVR